MWQTNGTVDPYCMARRGDVLVYRIVWGALPYKALPTTADHCRRPAPRTPPVQRTAGLDEGSSLPDEALPRCVRG